MKTIITIITITIMANLNAQVGIGIESPDVSAMMDVNSTVKGFLPPRMTTAQRDVVNGGNPSAGLVIYNLDVHCLEFFNGTQWVSFCDGDSSLKSRLGGSGRDEAMAVQQSSGGGYIVAGHTDSSASGDASDTTHVGTGSGYAASMDRTPTGGYDENGNIIEP